MKISDFDYELPDQRIAQFPPKIRGRTRLLVLHKRSGDIEHRAYGDLADYLMEGDVVVLNDTKVIKARLMCRAQDGKQHELLLTEEHGKPTSHNTHRCLFRGKLHAGEKLQIGDVDITVQEVLAGGIAKISSPVDLFGLADSIGSVPLPPYMHREATPMDIKRYQTLFANKSGSVAAPTASLNFTKQLRNELKTKGVHIVCLTLHIGLGTFLPIRSDRVEQHQMHSEYFEIPAATIEVIRRARADGKRICSIGTTVARTLEYNANKIISSPVHDLTGEADIFIYPGYQFQIVDTLLTNFHAPHSTVLMLAAAFATWPHLQLAYQQALERQYNFLSYGDSMLIC